MLKYLITVTGIHSIFQGPVNEVHVVFGSS